MRAMMYLLEKGTLVFATTHSKSTAEIIENIIKSFPKEDRHFVNSSLKNNLRLLVSQRLVPNEEGGITPVFEYISDFADIVANLNA